MITGADDEKFALLVDALGPYRDRVVIIGGWAHRLFRLHPLAQPVDYASLMTRDTDIALAPGISTDTLTLRERLLSRGFREEFLGNDRPPVTHYHVGGEDSGFYAEFLTPLVGSEYTRAGTRDVTTRIAGVSAQKLRYLDVLLIAPWSVPIHAAAGATTIMIANPVTYLVQKLLVSGKRKRPDRAKDVLYIHDTVELFGRSLRELQDVWTGQVQPSLGSRTEAEVRNARRRLFAEVTDSIREAALMSGGREASPQAILETCRFGLAQLLGERR